MALRELALRRTAERVEDDVQAYRTDKSIERVWKTEDVAAVLHRPRRAGDEHVVRSAARLADAARASTGTRRTSRRRACSGCRRASASASCARSSSRRTWARRPRSCRAATSADALVEYARDAQLLEGRRRPAPGARAGWPWRARHGAAASASWRRTSTSSRSAAATPGGAIAEPNRDAEAGADPRRDAKRLRYLLARSSRAWRRPRWQRRLHAYFDLANIVMLFLLTVVLRRAEARAAGRRSSRRSSTSRPSTSSSCRRSFSFAVTDVAVPADLRGDAGRRADHRAA